MKRQKLNLVQPDLIEVEPGKAKPRITEDERLIIETDLNEGKKPYAIAKRLGRPPKTVMREIKGRAEASDEGAPHRVTNRCAHRYDCDKTFVCGACFQKRRMQCKFCRQCNSHCPDYIEDVCERLDESPFVCNGCEKLKACTLRKRFYRHGNAQQDYRVKLVETRKGANVSEDELLAMDLARVASDEERSSRSTPPSPTTRASSP